MFHLIAYTMALLSGGALVAILWWVHPALAIMAGLLVMSVLISGGAEV